MSVKRSAVLLNTQAHAPARDDLVAALNAVCSREGWRTWEGIGYWLEASFRALRRPWLIGEALDKSEAEYMRVVKRCRFPQESMADLSRMLAATIEALEAEPVDFIGPLFGEFAASSQLGQFFTPYSLSYMMAKMIVGDAKKALADSGRRYLLCNEPACGVGGMILAANQALREEGLNPATQVHWIATDIDHAAICAAYVQTTLCGVSADIIHGNSISVETWRSTPTFAAVLHPKLEHRRHDASAPVEQPQTPPAPPTKAGKTKQLAFSFE